MWGWETLLFVALGFNITMSIGSILSWRKARALQAKELRMAHLQFAPLSPSDCRVMWPFTLHGSAMIKDTPATMRLYWADLDRRFQAMWADHSRVTADFWGVVVDWLDAMNKLEELLVDLERQQP